MALLDEVRPCINTVGRILTALSAVTVTTATQHMAIANNSVTGVSREDMTMDDGEERRGEERRGQLETMEER
jgi:hypothetical protein